MSGPPRLRLSPAAFAVAAAGPGAGPAREVVAELAEAGALVRDRDGRLLVDPALRALLLAWCGAAAAVEAVTGTPGRPRQLVVALLPPLAVCVLRAGCPQGPAPVEVSVPHLAGLRAEVVRQLTTAGKDRDHPRVWWRSHVGRGAPSPWWVGSASDVPAAVTATLDRATAFR